jgi:hypothetical protein
VSSLEQRIRRQVAIDRLTASLPHGPRPYDRVDAFFERLARPYDPVPTRRHR